MIRKWFEPIMDHNVHMQERMFRLLTSFSMLALIIIFVYRTILGAHVVNLLILAGCIIYIAAVAGISIKTHRFNTGAAFIALLLLILFPANYLTSGGMYGGAPLWFVFSFVYISLVLQGKLQIVFMLLCVVMTLLCYYIGFYHPSYVIQHTSAFTHLDSGISVVLVCALISATILLQKHIYNTENRITNEQKKEIEELNQAEQRFFSSMSHEIRTPINTIIGLNEMILRRGDIPDDIAENARNIQGASKMLLTLINDILDLSKMKSGKMDVVNVSYETGIFFSDIINMIWIKAQQKGLEFHLDIDSSIPSMLCGDEVRIKQILINILNNAVKYTNEGSVTLSVRCERTGLNQVRTYYNISDTGMGIKKESIPHLFDAFQRVDVEKNRYIEGTGLGLSIVRQLVELMGGEISVNSVYTKGSTFLVTLDQEIIDEKELGTFTLESHVNTGERTNYKQSFVAPSARLLIVDDNEMNLIVASKLLSETQLQIDTAASGKECLQRTQTTHYDGILMDHLMPEMDGIECLHAIRTQTGGMCQETPVIALTANAGSDSQLLYKKEGFSGYLAKPINGALLEATVLNILPKELVVVSEDSGQSKIGDEVLTFDQRKRIPIAITTDSMTDLPEELLNKFGISVSPYYICTEEGRFLDGKELQAEELLDYIAKGKRGYSHQPEVEDYERFFSQKLVEAQNVIHITMAKKVSEAFRTASEAANSFENVTILDSGHISSGIGLSVLYAANMAQNNATKAEIADAVARIKNQISSDFIVKNTKMLYYAGKFPKGLQALCDAMLIHPVIGMRKDKMTIGGIRLGDYTHITERYIRKLLKNTKKIDKRVLFIVHAGMDEQMLKYIEELALKYCPFEKVYLQKASCGITINAGPGAFGLMFMRKESM